MDKILVINKEKDYTSRDVVNIISGILGTKKVGHFGTLDPLATGVLVLGIGGCTKLCDLDLFSSKEYICEVLIGTSTDTYDITGNIILEEDNISIDKEVLITTLNSFVGKSIQEVPIYSAVKVNGKKLYEYARNNEEVILPKKEIEIYSIELLDDINELHFSFKVSVSKGTYIRSLVNDIAKKLNMPLTMSNLVRSKQGNITLSSSYLLEHVKTNNYSFLDIEDLIDLDICYINDDNKKTIFNGNMIDKVNKDYVLFKFNDENIVLYGINKKDSSKLKPIFFFEKNDL